MTREAIRLDPQKVSLYIARKGIPIKRLLDGMTAKTVHRIKAGQNTSPATAHKLAEKLGVSVDDLRGPIKADEMERFLPDHWLYDDIDAPSGIGNHHFLPCSSAFDGFICQMDQSPTGILNPIYKLLKWITSNRKIVLRQDDQTFVLELHYFSYSSKPNRTEEVVYNRATACRFFPLSRRGDNFEKIGLSDLARQYVWHSLHEMAMANAEIMSIEGHDYPDDPRAYFPLVRFSRGMAIKRVALGARAFISQYDLRESLLAYLKNLPNERVASRLTAAGISITVQPVRPAIFNPDWWSDELEFKVNLAWRMPDGQLAVAPWRETSRRKFIEGIAARDWREMHLEHMPLRFFSEENADEDAEPPLFEADPCLSAETFAALDGRDCPSFF